MDYVDQIAAGKGAGGSFRNILAYAVPPIRIRFLCSTPPG